MLISAGWTGHLQQVIGKATRGSTSPENALRIWEMTARLDVSELAKRVRVPTLVMHCSGDRLVPLEEARNIAKLIPGASFPCTTLGATRPDTQFCQGL